MNKGVQTLVWNPKGEVMAIEAGIPAPDFTLLDDKGTEQTLSGYLGRTVVLYFYPKDDTPG